MGSTLAYSIFFTLVAFPGADVAGVLLLTIFLNMYAALTNPFYNNPGIVDWLGIGPQIRSGMWITVLALLNGAVFLWVFAQLRSRARMGLAESLEDERELAAAEDEGFGLDGPRHGGDLQHLGGLVVGRGAEHPNPGDLR